MQGKHLTQKERFYIEKRRGEGVNQATIARELALPRSTISRELRRNTDPTFNGVYCCRRADTLVRGRRHKPLPNNAFYPLEPHIQNFIRQALSTHSSPEIISGRLHLAFGISVSKNTLYRYILQERQAGGELYQQLPHRENVTGTMPKTSNQALFPTVLVLSIAQLKPSLNRSLATSKLTLFLAKTRSHSC